MKKKNSSFFQEFAQSFHISLQAVYLGISLIIVLSMVAVITNSMQQTQDLRTQATKDGYALIGCNEPCEHNHQCKANHFCFQGYCRLASNPLSTDCDPNEIIPTPTDRPVIKLITPTPAEIIDKGDEVPIPTATPVATDSAVIDEVDPEEPAEPTTEPTVVPLSPTTEPEEYIVPEQPLSILDEIDQALQHFDLSLPIVLGVGLAGLILIVALAAILNQKRKNGFRPKDFTELKEKKINAQPIAGDKKAAPQKSTKNETEADDRVDFTRAEGEGESKILGEASSQNRSAVPHGSKERTAVPEPTYSKPTADTDSSKTSSSMTDRLKKKGVKKPG